MLDRRDVLGASATALAASLIGGSTPSAAQTAAAHAQARKDKSTPFEIVETSIDDIHAAFKPGKLTAHQLVQGYLDRIDAYDKQGPTINSIITLNPEALGGGRQAGRGVQGVRVRRPAAWHSDPGQGRDRCGRHADDARHSGIQGLSAAAGRLRRRQIAQGGRDHPRQDDAERVRGRRHLRLDVRRHAQSV